MELIIPEDIRKDVARLNQRARELAQKHGYRGVRLRYFGSGVIHPFTVIAIHELDASGTVRTKIHKLSGQMISEQQKPISTYYAAIKRYENAGFKFSYYISEIYAPILREMNLSPQAKVLELGPGKGELLAQILERGVEAHAVEFAPAVAAHLRRRFAKAISAKKLKVIEREYTEVSNTRWWQEVDGKMDHVVACASTETHLDPTRLFDTVKRALKVGGKFTVVECTPFHEELTWHLQQAGLEVEKVQVIPSPIRDVGNSYYTLITARRTK